MRFTLLGQCVGTWWKLFTVPVWERNILIYQGNSYLCCLLQALLLLPGCIWQLYSTTFIDLWKPTRFFSLNLFFFCSSMLDSMSPLPYPLDVDMWQFPGSQNILNKINLTTSKSGKTNFHKKHWFLICSLKCNTIGSQERTGIFQNKK